LQRVDVVVEQLDQKTKDLGLTSESLKNQAIVALKRDIPKLKIESSVEDSFIYIRITSTPIAFESGIRTGFAVDIEVSFHRRVRVIGDDSVETAVTIAAVWNKGTIATGDQFQVTSTIHQKINDFLTAFAAEYYKENP
jgi:hypothetical protein